MKIGELARISGLAPSTIRFYEEQGLLSPASRTASGYREYASNATERLYLIQASKRLGFSLDIIRGMFTESGQCSKPKTLALTEIRLREIEEQQAMLAQQRSDLLALRVLLQDDSVSAPCRKNFAVN
ncbi:MerR family transcriptional regulator [Duganella caerulea]|uniref:MerR family transcriptional regulator n=1 Tax=Duganella caerulea TaxID=2885762 RepID=UPI0030E79BAB